MMGAVSLFVDTAPEASSPAPSDVRASAKPVAGPSRFAEALGVLEERIDAVLAIVGARYRCTREDLISKSRKADIASPRHVAAWLLRKRGLSYPQIGRALGNRNHATVMHSLKVVNREAGKSPAVDAQLEAMLEALGGAVEGRE